MNLNIFIRRITGMFFILLLINNLLKGQTDTLCSPASEIEIYAETYYNFGSTNNAFSQFNRVDVVFGQALVTPSIVQSQSFQAGFGSFSPFLLPPDPPVLRTSQGDFKDRITVSWEVNPLSPQATAFTLYRDGSFLTRVGPDVATYIDFNIQAGEFYKYSIVAANSFGDGSPKTSIGFVNPNGVVTGQVKTTSGNPVPNTIVRLTPKTGRSLSFDGVDDHLCVDYNEKLRSQMYTISAYVKIEEANNGTGIIDMGSALNKNFWIKAKTIGGSMGYSVHIGDGTASDSIEYALTPISPTDEDYDHEWHQVTLIYNGVNMTLLVDGAFIATKAATLTTEKNRISIGSLLDGNYFKGNIDDIRIYNRPLTQSEVQSTLDRTLSSSEEGLIAYWKMDEGIGEKVFDFSETGQNAFIYGPTFDSNIPDVYNAGVTDLTGFYAIDGINYSAVESFKAQPMKNFNYNTALEFSAADKACADLTSYAIPDSSTIELTFHPFDLKSTQSILHKEGDIELWTSNGNLFLDINGTLTNLGTLSTKYYRLAITLDNGAGSADVYLDGSMIKENISYTPINNWVDTKWLLGSDNCMTGTQLYTGLIDEFVIYDGLLDQQYIETSFVIGTPQTGYRDTIIGLRELNGEFLPDTTFIDYPIFSLFDLNEGEGTEIVDYAAVNDPTIGTTRIGSVRNASWSSNVRSSDNIPHEYQPNQRVVNVNLSNTAIGNMDFVDVSTINIAGTVRFENTFCFSQQVEILVNGQSHVPPIFTNIDGEWSADFEPGKTMRLSAVYKDHLFSPGFIEFRNLQSPKAGIVLLDVTKRTIEGQITGGLCRQSIIDANDRVIVKVEALNGCLEKELIITNPNGKYKFENLPAIPFAVKIIEHSNLDVYNFFQTKGGQEVDLTDIPADTVDFVYIAPVNVELEEFPRITCAPGDTLDYPILPQSANEDAPKFNMPVRVYEQYVGGRCYLDTATIIVNNGVQGSEQESFEMDSTVFVYEFLAGAPNIIAPYTKNLQICAQSNGSQDCADQNIIVVGKRSRESTFTSEAPSDQPIWILRDPPGDASFATLESGSTRCETYSNAASRSESGSLEHSWEVGKKVTTFTGLGAGVIEENGSVSENSMKGTVNFQSGTTGETEVCYTTTQSYSTSDGDNIVGRLADVFIGTTMNFEYGVNDVIYYDPNSCMVTDTIGFYLNPKQFGTEYVYSRWQLLTDVIPSLEQLGKFDDANRWRKILEEDEYFLKEKSDFSASGLLNSLVTPSQLINGIIDLLPGSSLIPNALRQPVTGILEDAVEEMEQGLNTGADFLLESIGVNVDRSPDTIRYMPTFEQNITFDGLSNYTQSWSRSDKELSTTTFDFGGAFNSTINPETTVFGISLGAKIEMAKTNNYSNSQANSTTKETTITYTLADDDPNDNFSIDIFKKNNLPVFSLKAGESMCPWEIGTLNREEVGLRTSEGVRRVNIPENVPATFPIHISNIGQTGNDPLVFLVGTDLDANPDGAIISLNGEALVNPVRIQLNPGQEVELLITVEKGPTEFSYDSLGFFFVSECMYEHSLSLGYDISQSLGYIINDPSTAKANQNSGVTTIEVDPAVAADKFYKELRLSVDFIEPCSPIDIGFPLQGFVVTPAAENILNITLNEYDPNDTDLKAARVQYRRVGGDGAWINIREIPATELEADRSTIIQWNTELLKDGQYEIRAITECDDPGLPPGISQLIRGTLERRPPEIVGVPQPADGTWDPGDEISITFNEDIDCDKVFQADRLGNNTIGLYDTTTDQLVDATISCLGNKITIVPNINPAFFENRTFRVLVSGQEYDEAKRAINPNHPDAGIRDRAGNAIVENVKWEFFVNQNDLEWVGSDIIEVAEVLKPITVTRKIRNRGGTLVNFRMEDIPSWLKVTPTTGTLNPGQLADVTFEFQKDLLIGDYFATIQMSGSKGDEPLGIDYRVRCPQPDWQVVNPSQYGGSMNMVARLDIFGEESTDPSDIVVALIDGEIRGVSSIDYYRQLDTDIIGSGWLAFITIFGDARDAGKEITFNVWDGEGCVEYAEVLERITFQDGELIGGPVSPDTLHVINLVQKCIDLNQGWNWLSINLDLGDNSVSNVLDSLTHKEGALIKDDVSFSKYYVENNLGWRNSLKTIDPKKRYMLYLEQTDELCIKGMPYEPAMNSIIVHKGWNWIGYIPQIGMSVSHALRDLNPLNGDIIKDQTRFAQYVAGIGWVGNINFMEAPTGYLLKISNPGVLTYNTSTQVFNGVVTQPIRTKSRQADLPFAQSKYNSTMNVIAEVSGIDIEPGDELRGYINGLLKGSIDASSAMDKELFFLTLYHDDPEMVDFRLYKADRKKELPLSGRVSYRGESLSGLVQEPIILNYTSTGPVLDYDFSDQVIYAPMDTTYDDLALEGGHADSISCDIYSFNTILPTGNEINGPDCMPVVGQQNNMTGVARVSYNERSNFVSVSDELFFYNPQTDEIVGCGSTEVIGDETLFNFTVTGENTIDSTPVDVHYYSSEMDSTFIVRSGIYYKKDRELGDVINPIELNFSPLRSTMINDSTLSVTLADTNWVGTYCIELFAMNCDNGFSDGETTICFRRWNMEDCVEMEMRSGTEDDMLVRAQTIQSEALVNGDFIVHYLAGQQVELKEGFEVMSDGVLLIEIIPCTNIIEP